MPPRSPSTFSGAPLTLPSVAGAITIKAVTDLPARLFGGNAQQVEVTGLDYTLHLDIEKLPDSGPTPNEGKWTVVWDEAEDTYKRVEFTNLPAPPYVPPIVNTLIGGYASHAMFLAATIPVDVGMVETLGYYRPGDQGGARWRRVASEPLHPGKAQTADGGWWEMELVGSNPCMFGARADDVRDASGTSLWAAGTDYTLGLGTTGTFVKTGPGPRWQDYNFYQLTTDPGVGIPAANAPVGLVKGQEVIGADGYGWTHMITDNATAFVNWVEANRYTRNVRICLPQGRFYVGQTIHFNMRVHLTGAEGDGNTLGLTRIRFPENIDGFVFHHSDSTVGSDGDPDTTAGGSVIENFRMHCSGRATVNTTTSGSGIRAYTKLLAYNVGVWGFYDGFRITGAGSTANSNVAHFEKCQAYYNIRHGIYADGPDANAITFVACDTSLNGGAGVHESSFLGNMYYGHHFAHNGDRVAVLGSDNDLYLCKLDHVTVLGTTEPVTGTDWATYWEPFNGSKTATMPATYDGSVTTIEDGLAYNQYEGYNLWCVESSNRSAFVACYNEDGNALNAGSSAALVMGGIAGNEGTWRGYPTVVNGTALRARSLESDSATTGKTTVEAQISSASAASAFAYNSERFPVDGDRDSTSITAKVGKAWDFNYSPADQMWAWRYGTGTGAYCLRISETNFNIKRLPEGRVDFENGFALNSVMWDCDTTPPSYPTFSSRAWYKQGERRWNETPGPNENQSWVCTVGGPDPAVTAWVAGTDYAVKNVRHVGGYAYECSRDPGGGVYTVPTHLLDPGPVGPDGFGYDHIPVTPWVSGTNYALGDHVTRISSFSLYVYECTTDPGAGGSTNRPNGTTNGAEVIDSGLDANGVAGVPPDGYGWTYRSCAVWQRQRSDYVVGAAPTYVFVADEYTSGAVYAIGKHVLNPWRGLIYRVLNNNGGAATTVPPLRYEGWEYGTMTDNYRWRRIDEREFINAADIRVYRLNTDAGLVLSTVAPVGTVIHVEEQCADGYRWVNRGAMTTPAVFQPAGESQAWTTIATDAAATLACSTHTRNILHTGTLTANRTLSLSGTSAVDNFSTFKVVRTGGGAFTLSIGGLKALNPNEWAEVSRIGGAWVLTGFGTL